jgi:Zn-dependent protease
VSPVRRYQLAAAVLAVLLLYLVVHRHVVGADTVIFFGVLFGSIILHEVSHGAVALAFGDDTAKRAGRLTLNPLPHIDIVGTVILPAILVLSGFGAFGWAKPVPVNVGKLRHPRNEALLVALAGPAVNVALAVGAALVYRFAFGPVYPASILERVVFFLGYANVLLAAFNLIPIPPLDGSAVVERLLPRRWWPGYLQLRMYALPVLVVLVLLVPGALEHVFSPALDWWSKLLQ